MSEEDVRDGLRGAVTDEPPLVFDPDELMATARRQTTRRRALVSAGVATTVVAVAAVAVPFALDIRGGDDGVTVGSPPATTTALSTVRPRDVEWPPPGARPAHYTAAELNQRGEEMRAHLSTTFGAVVPEASGIEVRPFGGEAEGVLKDGQAYLNAFTRFSVDGVRYAVDVQTFMPGTAPSPEEQCATCAVRELPDGSWIQVSDDRQDAAQIVSVVHFRTTGATVRATGYNYDVTDSSPRFAPAIPVTVEQLTTLATDPALYL